MSAALRKPMTLEQFLAWEERQPSRHEFDGSRPVAMTGGTAAHAAIQRNVLFSLTSRLHGTRCQAYGSDLKVRVADRIRYPDAFVVCTPVQPRSTIVTEPVIVFQVLSDNTASDDLIAKNAEYRATPSILRYVVLHQTRLAAIVFSRKGEDWVTDLVASAEAVLRLPEIGMEIPLQDLYAGLSLDGTDEAVSAG